MKMEEVIARQPKAGQAQLRELFKHFPSDGFVIQQTIEKGVIFIREGAPSMTVYLLLKGAAETFWTQPGLGQYTALHKQPLTFLGDLEALGEYPNYTASMRTVERCVFITIHRSLFLQWLNQDPDMHRILALKNLRMLVKQGHDSRNIAMQPTDIRILEYLNWCYETGQMPQQETVLIKKTRERIAEDIGGVSLRTLNRYLSQMDHNDYFSIVKGKIQISREQNDNIKTAISKQIN